MKRVAIFTQGGVTRPGSIGNVPALVQFVRRLSEDFDIMVYTTSTDDNHTGTFACGNATVIATEANYNDRASRKLKILTTRFLRDHRQVPFDLLHGLWALPSGFLTVLLSRVLHIPSVVSVLGADTAAIPQIGYGHLLRAATRIPTIWTCTNATALTVETRYQLKQLIGHGLQRMEVSVIPLGIEATLFIPGVHKSQPPPFNLLHVANLTEVKDQETLLRTFQEIKKHLDTRLRIIGPDYRQGVIQQMAKSLGIDDSVDFLGRLDNTTLPEHYSWAHLLLHTSYHEGSGAVIAEAAACGTVTCGTRVGLIADLEDQCTVAVDLGDHKGLARKAISLLNNTTRLRQLEENARSWALEHDCNWTSSQYRELYDKLLSGDKRGSMRTDNREAHRREDVVQVSDPESLTDDGNM